MLHQFLVTTLLLVSAAAYSSNQDTVRRIAAAPVDEWFYGVGSEKNTWLVWLDDGVSEHPSESK